jgi:hypothetical protein
MKVCNGDGECGFFFRMASNDGPPGPWFADVSTAWGLGPDGLASESKGDTLAVADFNGDDKPDLLYGAGTGMLFLNQNGKFVLKADSGISYKPGKIGPSLCDFGGDGNTDLFVPQIDGKCKLLRNDGTGKFADVTASSGDLAKAIPWAVSAAWGDFDNDGKPDLVVCCLRGSNRYFKNNGNGTFTDKSIEIGLTQRLFNSQAATFADLNGDGQLDLILVNEGQESNVLFGVTGPATGERQDGRVRVDQRHRGSQWRKGHRERCERQSDRELLRHGRRLPRRAVRAHAAVRPRTGRVQARIRWDGQKGRSQGRDGRDRADERPYELNHRGHRGHRDKQGSRIKGSFPC